MKYEGLRFRAACTLAGKVYGQPFGVDVAFGDPILGEPEVAFAEDTLAFAGIAPPTLRLYPVETHVAGKLHAYTMPRARPNSRVKDLPDLALLATLAGIGAHRTSRWRAKTAFPGPRWTWSPTPLGRSSTPYLPMGWWRSGTADGGVGPPHELAETPGPAGPSIAAGNRSSKGGRAA